MIKKMFYLLAVLAVLTGCEKEPAPKVSKVVKKMECLQGGKIISYRTYTYDKSSKLSEVKMSYTGGSNSTLSFLYADESVTILNGGESYILSLDKTGKPEKIISNEGIRTCTYGLNGYLEKFDVETGTGKYELPSTNQNGNFVMISDLDGSPLKIEYTQYENDYSIDLNSVVPIENMFTCLNSLKVNGMYSANLVKSITTADASYYFTYNFDAKDRVTDMVVMSTASTTSLTEHYRFTY